jgi:hypothetical protein
LEAVLRQTGGFALDHVEVHAMEGDGIAVAVNQHHNTDPSIKIPSVCYIDGDSKQNDSADKKVYRLPGEAPESYVFDQVLSVWQEFGGKISVALLQRFENAVGVHEICKQVRLTNRDPHLLFSQVGERLGLIPESTVAAAFANIWAQAHSTERARIIDPIKDSLPSES